MLGREPRGEEAAPPMDSSVLIAGKALAPALDECPAAFPQPGLQAHGIICSRSGWSSL